MPRTEFWTDRTVGWYARALARSDFAAKVVAAIGPALAGCRDALDVGAGCGALALPLAQRLERVTALEPSPAMARGLRQAAAAAGLGNVTVVEAAWGEVDVAPHDLVVCAHVGELLKAGSAFLAATPALTRRLLVLVRDAPRAEDQDKFFYRELYPALLGRVYEHRSHASETLAGLRAVGIEPRVTTIEYSSDQPFEDLDEACDFWMTYMGLEGQPPRDYLKGFLSERLVKTDGKWRAPFRKTAVLFIWSPGHPVRRPGRPG
ncbi:MAG: class I SAM-dependent methyltransferase [Candidatus Rokubacteria bacterium]|nr:class I SAM-dependent methyltransferase [Candidatus Rokubacteria bacterium]